MFSPSTSTIETAGVRVSPAPRRQALAENMKMLKGSESERTRT